MSMRQEENDIYIIPPNFIDTGTVFGGTIKLRNAAEALAVSLLIGLPVFHLPVTLTTKIIIACLTVLPAALFAVIGINGESLSSFAIGFFVYLKNRRVVGLAESAKEPPGETHTEEKAPGKQRKAKKPKPEKKVKPKKEDFAEEFGQFRERRQARQASDGSAHGDRQKKQGVPQAKGRIRDEQEPELLNPSAAYLPIRKIKNGIIYTKDRRYVKVIEVVPINFLLRSAREQRNIIYSFISYLKISPVKLQFKVLTRRADINRHLETLREEMRQETDERCLALQKDYEGLIRRIGSREAITRRFFIIFEYEPFSANRGNEESDAVSALTTAVRTAKTYLQQCGNELIVPDNEDEMAAEVFYSILNRKTSVAGCYPFTSFEMCDDNGILLGVNKHNNSLIIVDIFNSRVYKNANMAILGTSGAGKTFTMQLMALRMRRRNIQVFIIAPLKGHEFHRACSNIGGEFIQISPASRNCINIMEIRKVDSSANDILDGPQTEKSELAAKIQRLHIFFSLLIPDMTHEERQLLDEALIQAYNQKGITHNNDSLPDPKCPERYREMPVLEDVFNILKKNADTRRLANIMNRLVHGSASTFNQQTNVNLDNKYTVLDISELTGDLLTVGMFVALDYVWDKAKEDRTVEKAIFIDETWQLIGAASNRLAAEFVLEIFKIIRGYGGSAICATQDLNDFFALEDGKYGKAIINNAKTKIVLNLEDEEAMRVQSILHLSEAETMAITHFERGNGLISTNNNNVTVEFKASELEKELITTDRSELKTLLEKERQRRQVASEAV